MTESFLGEDITFFFLPDFRSDQKLEGFGLSAFQKKVLQTHKLLHTLKCIGCIILRHLGVTREQIKEKKNEKKKKHPVFVFKTQDGKAVLSTCHMHRVLWYTQSLTGILL